jgi:pimeloyl-ACP methyl ester carboxylesterase
MVILPVLERVTRAVLSARGVESRHVDTPIARVHVYDARGRGEHLPVVMLHGIGASSSPFAPILERLRKKSRRVLALDAPGHGLSGAPARTLGPETLFEALSYVLERELDGPALVVGCSLGGAMALRYAQRCPERVAGLVLASPGGAPVEDPDERSRFLRGFELENVKDARAFLERLHHEVPWYGPLVAPDVVRIFKNPAVKSILSSLKPEHFFAPGELATLPMPIHVLWGKSDRVIPQCCLAFFKENLPAHAVFEEPEGIGHSPHIEAPREFVRVIEACLEKVAR